MFSIFSLDGILGIIPTWVPWAIIFLSVTSFVLVQVLSFLIPVMYRTIIVILVEIIAVVLFGFGFYIDGRQDIIVSQEAKIKQVVAYQEEITKKTLEDYQSKQAEVKVKNETIIKYITKKDDDLCRIPNSFISLHNYAATKTVPDSTTGVDGSSPTTSTNTGK